MVLKEVIRCRTFVLRLIISLLISGSFAFAYAAEDESALAQSIRREVEQQYLGDAISAFKAGDYGRAGNVFEMLSQSAQSPEISRQALFGLAAVKLVTARTAGEYEDAFATWQKWSGQAGPGTAYEDPRMLSPFLLKLEPEIKGAAVGRSAAPGGMAGREVDTRGILQTKEKEMQTLRAKLDQREREIRRLRLQLESLEEIHREYQEKKQEATPVSPAPHK
jgi:hypothetical protein